METIWRDGDGILVAQGEVDIRLCRIGAAPYLVKNPPSGDVWMVTVLDQARGLDEAVVALLGHTTGPTWLMSPAEILRGAEGYAEVSAIWQAWKVANPGLDWTEDRLRVRA